MKPAPFAYHAPRSLAEALEIMEQNGFDAKLLAGGQSLIPVMNFRLAQPGMLVDLNHIPELAYVQQPHGGGLRIGAMTRHSQLEHSDTAAASAPLIHDVMPLIAHTQIRNRGTIGGSLAHADPAAELPVVMVAREARFRLQRQSGDRWVNAPDFYEALFTTALEPEEILVEVVVPPIPDHTGYAFLEFARRHGDYAQAGVAALVTLDGNGICRQARLVYLNVGDIPMVARRAGAMLVGQKPDPELIESAARLASKEEIEPAGDIHASAAYKRHLAYVLGKRALRQAITHAEESFAS